MSFNISKSVETKLSKLEYSVFILASKINQINWDMKNVNNSSCIVTNISFLY